MDTSYIGFAIILIALIVFYLFKGLLGLRQKTLTIYTFPKSVKVEGRKSLYYSILYLLVACLILVLFIVLTVLYFQSIH